MSERLGPELQDFTNRVNKYAQFDAPFVMDGSTIAGRFWGEVPGVTAPEVYHDETDDIVIDGVRWEDCKEWEPIRCFSGQYGYKGAVMHASEFIGSALAEHMSDLSEIVPQVFVVVVVNVLPTDDDKDPEPAGWAILYRDADPLMFKCAFPAV